MILIYKLNNLIYNTKTVPPLLSDLIIGLIAFSNTFYKAKFISIENESTTIRCYSTHTNINIVSVNREDDLREIYKVYAKSVLYNEPEILDEIKSFKKMI